MPAYVEAGVGWRSRFAAQVLIGAASISQVPNRYFDFTAAHMRAVLLHGGPDIASLVPIPDHDRARPVTRSRSSSSRPADHDAWHEHTYRHPDRIRPRGNAEIAFAATRPPRCAAAEADAPAVRPASLPLRADFRKRRRPCLPLVEWGPSPRYDLAGTGACRFRHCHSLAGRAPGGAIDRPSPPPRPGAKSPAPASSSRRA